MIVRFSHIMLFCQRHAESVKWYCDKLGFEVEYNAPGEYASLNHKLIGRVALHATDTAKHLGKGPMPYLLCDNMETTVAELRSKGIEVKDPTREGESPWFTQFRDLEGNEWGIEEM